jgi:hypothetical protein
MQQVPAADQEEATGITDSQAHEGTPANAIVADSYSINTNSSEYQPSNKQMPAANREVTTETPRLAEGVKKRVITSTLRCWRLRLATNAPIKAIHSTKHPQQGVRPQDSTVKSVPQNNLCDRQKNHQRQQATSKASSNQ